LAAAIRLRAEAEAEAVEKVSNALSRNSTSHDAAKLNIAREVSLKNINQFKYLIYDLVLV
jgi:hypothetical protein